MDVVVDRNFILSQEKIQERIKASERHNIATEEKTVQQKRTRPSHIRCRQNQRAESKREIALAQPRRYHKTNRNTREK
jgi:hypothetical protein